MSSPLHSAEAMALAIANDPSLVGVAPRPETAAAPLYQSLTSQSTPEQIASAYKEYTGMAGGDTQAAQESAVNYLTNLGLAAPTITQAYNLYTQPAQTPVPSAIEQLYQQYAGRASDSGGAQYWAQQFGDTIDPDETAKFQSAIAEARAQGTEPAAMPSYFVQNPDVAAAYQQNTYGLSPEQFAQTHYNKYGMAEGRAASGIPSTSISEISNTPGMGVGGIGLSGASIPGAENTYEKLVSQILGQGITDKWSGEGFGSADANARDMARILAAAGITDINQFGQTSKPIDVSVTPIYNEAREITGYQGPNGMVDPSLVKTDVDWDGGVNYVAPVGSQSQFVNKLTGEVIDKNYDKGGANIWGGTFAGSGSTGYGVQFTPDGTPVFYTQYGGSSNDLAQIMEDPLIGSIIQGAAAYFGGPLGSAAVNLLAGKDIEDAAKAALATYVAGEVATAVGGSNAAIDALGKTGAKVAGNVAGAVATGGDPVQALIAGGVGAAMPAISAQIPGYSDLSASQKAFVNSAIASTLRDGNLSPEDLVRAAFASGRVAANEARREQAAKVPVVDMEPTSYGTNITKQLADAGAEEDVNLPTGIQLASADGETPFRIEASGSPIFAEDPRAAKVSPPAGYRLMSASEETEIPGAEGERSRYTKPEGAYYDYTANAWFVPTSFEDLFPSGFGGSAGAAGGSSTSSGDDYADFLQSIGIGNTTGLGASPSNREILDAIGYREPDFGTIDVAAPRIPSDDFGTIDVTAPRIPADDMGEVEITAPRIPPEDIAEIPETEFPEIEATAPREPTLPGTQTPPTKTPTAPATPTTPAQVTAVKKQIAKTLNLPMSSPIVQDVIEALYGTMEYLDLEKELQTAPKKARPAATQKQQQQTKMAEGGYLDDLLAENMTADDLLNLLR